MKNLALASAGVIVSFATCEHPEHPSEAVIDGCVGLGPPATHR